VNAALVHRVAPIRIVRIAMPLLLAAALVLLGLAATGAGGVLGVLAPLWVILFLLGFIIGNAAAIALSRRGERAGTAAAVIGASQSGVAALVSPLVGLLGGDAFAMSLAIVMSLLAAMLVLAIATPAYRSDLGGAHS
jgi:DHA1 family bicyclomycin/chloramphenicol resistance-like MFS transporter